MNYLEQFFDRRKAEKRLSPEEARKFEEKRLIDQREKMIAFKKFFGTAEGQEVMLDLINKFLLSHMPDNVTDVQLARTRGAQDVVLYLLSRARVSIEDFDRVLRGEF